ncbi:MAG: hypothetical protein ACLQDV_00535 [Candidatus Binataceae bacterium]
MKKAIPRAFWCVFVAEAVLLIFCEWRNSFDFAQYLYQDQGSALAAQYLLGQGLRPEIDFGYNYGLLPLLLGKIPFDLLGCTPQTYAIIVVVAEVVVAVGMARIVSVLQLRWSGLALVVLALPLVICRYNSLTYALEAAFLINAFAEQLRERFGNAIALALCAALSKPAMGYVYGAVLLLLLFNTIHWRRRDWMDAARTSRPAMVTALIVLPILARVFGARSLFRTMLPIQGLAFYRATHILGLHWQELTFLRPPGINWHYYVGSYIAFQVIGTLWLLIGGVIASVKLVRGRQTAERNFVLTASVLMIADLLLFSLHCQFIVPIGVIVSSTMVSGEGLQVILCLLAIPAFCYRLESDLAFTRARTRSALTGGMWAQSELNSEWERAIAIAARTRTVALGSMGAAGLVVPGIERPVGAYFLPGSVVPADLTREYRQLAAAQAVILFHHFPEKTGTVLETYPMLEGAVKDADDVYKGDYLEVLVRRSHSP